MCNSYRTWMGRAFSARHSEVNEHTVLGIYLTPLPKVFDSRLIDCIPCPLFGLTNWRLKVHASFEPVEELYSLSLSLSTLVKCNPQTFLFYQIAGVQEIFGPIEIFKISSKTAERTEQEKFSQLFYTHSIYCVFLGGRNQMGTALLASALSTSRSTEDVRTVLPAQSPDPPAPRSVITQQPRQSQEATQVEQGGALPPSYISYCT